MILFTSIISLFRWFIGLFITLYQLIRIKLIWLFMKNKPKNINTSIFDEEDH